MNHSPDSPGQDEALVDNLNHQKRLLLLIALGSTLVTPLLYFYSDNRLEAATALYSALSSWLLYLTLRSGRLFLTALLVNIGVLVVAVMAVLAFGSVRNAANFLFVGVLVGAGSFFGRKVFAGIFILVASTLGLLSLAEHQGLLRIPDQHVGLKTWIVQVICLAVVALLVYRNRQHVERSSTKLNEELELRQKTEQERDQSLDRFARFFNTSPSPMLALSARDSTIVDANPAFLQCYGYKREEILGRDETSLWAIPAQREPFLKRLVADRTVLGFECKALRSDGSTFDALISSALGNDPKDHLVITTVTDVTEHTTARIRLQKSEERFAKAFNFSPLKLIITRLSDGSFVEVNDADNGVQCLSASELRGNTSIKVGSWLDPADRTAFVDQLKREGRLNGFETQMRHKDGRTIDTRLWAVIIDIDGEDCILSCAVNISEEKRREALLLGVAQGMTGESGKAFFEALSRHMAEALAADVVVVSELLIDRRVSTLSVWKDGQSDLSFVYDSEGTPCAQTLQNEALCVFEDGMADRFPFESTLLGVRAQAYVGMALRDADGSSMGILMALWRNPIALTQEMRALMAIFASRASAELIRLRRDREIQNLNENLELRVRERTSELRKLNAELDSFAYSVSHDLKSPLRAIDGFTRLLGEQLEGRLMPDETALFDRVLAATRRMSELIADLLGLARVSQGTMERIPTSLSEMAEHIMRAEQLKQPERRLEWHVEAGLTCNCDPHLMRIAMENLLGNAVKYTRHQQHPKIEIGRVSSGASEPPQFFVRDNGVGFDIAHSDKLFKPFQRLHTASEFEGTGIGLATVRRIVERHGGSIWAESTLGQGATFYMALSAAS
ncbi:MAG: ATP-binding protein [Hydrogenophaga sp.]